MGYGASLQEVSNVETGNSVLDCKEETMLQSERCVRKEKLRNRESSEDTLRPTINALIFNCPDSALEHKADTTTLQSARKVAVLNVLDKGNILEDGAKLMLQTCLLDAVIHYGKGNIEVYDRTDKGKIVEDSFQLSSYVSASQIKPMSQPTSCDCILVSEVIELGNQQILLTAKIINVKTGRIEGRTANKRCDVGDYNNYCIACQQLVDALFTGWSK